MYIYIYVEVASYRKCPARVLLVQGGLQLAARVHEIGQGLVDVLLDGLPDFGGRGPKRVNHDVL